MNLLHRNWIGALALVAACGPATQMPMPRVISDDPSDVPVKGATQAQLDVFDQGDRLFDLPFRPADGLGPLYIRTSCGACHQKAGKGPGLVQKMVVVDPDGSTVATDQSALAWGHTVRPYFTAGATQSLAIPTNLPLKVTTRLGPPLFGRGYLEAVEDSEILRLETEQAARADGIHGRINRVEFHSEANAGQSVHNFKKGDRALIGRFGLKARNATLDDFAADAFAGDMGMTSPMRPAELANPDGLTDDDHPGADLTLDTVNQTADYMRLIAIPRRETPSATAVELFTQTRCAACHVPSLRTRSDYPVPQLAGIDAPLYSDLLVHELGEALADGITDEQAGSAQWRTAPLIGLRFLRSYLHDGRALTVEEAVLAHQGEAADSRSRFEALSASQRADLLKFVESL